MQCLVPNKSASADRATISRFGIKTSVSVRLEKINIDVQDQLQILCEAEA